MREDVSPDVRLNFAQTRSPTNRLLSSRLERIRSVQAANPKALDRLAGDHQADCQAERHQAH